LAPLQAAQGRPRLWGRGDHLHALADMAAHIVVQPSPWGLKACHTTDSALLINPNIIPTARPPTVLLAPSQAIPAILAQFIPPRILITSVVAVGQILRPPAIPTVAVPVVTKVRHRTSDIDCGRYETRTPATAL